MATNNLNDPKAQEICRAFGQKVSDRALLDQNYSDCYKLTFPELNGGFQSAAEMDGTNKALAAQVDQIELMTSIGKYAARTLAAAIISSLTPGNVRWFNLDFADTDYEQLSQVEKQWLDEASDVVHKKIHMSNYDSVGLEFTQHLVVAGMGGLFIDWDDDENGLFMESHSLAKLYVEDTLGKGRIDTVYIPQMRTLSQIVNSYGTSKLPSELMKKYSDNPYDPSKFKLIICIRPNLDEKGKQYKGKLKGAMAWEECVVLESHKVILKEDGYRSFPLVAPRWMKLPDSQYASGPVAAALPDLKTVNHIYRLKLMNGDLKVAGAYTVLNDGVMNVDEIEMGPHALISVESQDAIKPLNVGGDLQIAHAEIQGYEAAIGRIMMADQLLPATKSIQTAAEVTSRANQMRQVLGPVFSRLQAEFITPLVERSTSLCLHKGALPEIPESIRKNVLTDKMRIKYTSPLARAQKLNELDAVDQLVQRLANLAQIDPGIMDNFDFDIVAREAADLLGVPAKIMKEKRDVDALRKQRAQMKAQADAQQAAMQGAGAPPTQKQGALSTLTPASQAVGGF